MIETNDSNSHELDGIDPDAHMHRQNFRFPEASRLVDDMQERRHMAEAVKKRYAQTH